MHPGMDRERERERERERRSSDVGWEIAEA